MSMADWVTDTLLPLFSTLRNKEVNSNFSVFNYDVAQWNVNSSRTSATIVEKDVEV